MKPISDFFPRLMPHLPGCPEPQAAQALVDAAIAFCEDSHAVNEALDTFQTAVGVSEYELEPPSQQSVARLLAVKVGDRPMAAIAAEDVSLISGATGTPIAYYTTRLGSELKLHLFPTPDTAETVEVTAALRPTRTATSLQDDLFNYWVDGVVAGALSRCMRIPAQPFSDPVGAASYGAIALQAARKAKLESRLGRVQSGIRATARPIA